MYSIFGPSPGGSAGTSFCSGAEMSISLRPTLFLLVPLSLSLAAGRQQAARPRLRSVHFVKLIVGLIAQAPSPSNAMMIIVRVQNAGYSHPPPEALKKNPLW